jgi:hypothetical protein
VPARILLILTGLSTLGIAATPEPATGPTWRHLAFALSCVVTTAVWPVLVARRAPARAWILGVGGCATVTVIFAGLSCWLLIAARDGGGDLGLVERLTSAVQGLFPLVVALAMRRPHGTQATSDHASRERFRGWQAGTPIGRRTVPSGRKGLRQQPSPARTSPGGAIFRRQSCRGSRRDVALIADRVLASAGSTRESAAGAPCSPDWSS